MRETTETIGSWADETFGAGTIRARSLRLLAEACELCHAAGVHLVEVVDAADRAYLMKPADPARIPEELADCEIVLRTVAHTGGIDLESEVDAKMAINRARKWRMTGGGCGQHIPSTTGEDR